MNTFYQTHQRGIIVAHDTLEEAKAYAEGRRVFSITEVGGRFDEWVRCELCGEWTISDELSADGYCHVCEALKGVSA